ncbi:hypothetical protein DSO57_1035108 [Entomophthora muscae]|uniref:Uncharacterized protein n=1 Tax=Entomophthora muscae TaxID=34485 RepID=A0ACC2T078_9FUNG|nr:hypothetical protein DSO57_1035108 [Entomophthora muscae]
MAKKQRKAPDPYTDQSYPTKLGLLQLAPKFPQTQALDQPSYHSIQVSARMMHLWMHGKATLAQVLTSFSMNLQDGHWDPGGICMWSSSAGAG